MNVNEKTHRNPGWLRPFQDWVETGEHVPANLNSSMEFNQVKSVAFGQEAREKMFLLDKSLTYLNHGAYGSCFSSIFDFRIEMLKRNAANPVLFYEQDVLPSMVDSIHKLSSFVNCDPEDLVLLPNATSCVNSVIKSYIPFLNETSRIVCFNIIYGSNYNTMSYVSQITGAEIVEISVEYPYDMKTIIASIEDEFKKHEVPISLAVFDHISSFPCIKFPIKEIVEICHKYEALVFVDGAHAVGNIEIDLKDINADFYTSNCHKWLCTPHSVAFLYVKKEHHAWVVNSTISHGHSMNGLATEFVWQATFDYTPYLTISKCIDIWDQMGRENVMNHNHELAAKAATYLAQRWNTELAIPLDLSCSMATVFIPEGTFEAKDYVAIHKCLRQVYNIESRIGVINERLAVRISAQIYNDMKDYERLADAVINIQMKGVVEKEQHDRQNRQSNLLSFAAISFLAVVGSFIMRR